MFSTHSAFCRCRSCTGAQPRSPLVNAALTYGPAAAGLIALFFLLA